MNLNFFKLYFIVTIYHSKRVQFPENFKKGVKNEKITFSPYSWRNDRFLSPVFPDGNDGRRNARWRHDARSYDATRRNDAEKNV